jgi:AAA+ ATPase superfamily predicted ATPase
LRSTKKSLYKINDPFLNFYFTFLVPNKSRLEFGLVDQVLADINMQYDKYLSGLWEELCRQSVLFMEIEGKRFNPAARWWGNNRDGKPVEIDLVAESTDKSTLLVGEVKWSNKMSASEISTLLNRKCDNLPFTGARQIIKAIFIKERPISELPETLLFVPDDVLQVLL